MRGGDRSSGELFSYVDLEPRVPGDHPLRAIREIEYDVPAGMEEDFSAMYAPTGRPSIAPEQLLRALLRQAFYSILSKRQLMEQFDFSLLFRRFIGLGMDDRVWDSITFCHNRDRLLSADVSARFLRGIVEHKKVRRLLSRDYFSVDGTLIAAWASMKSFRAKDEVGAAPSTRARSAMANKTLGGEKRRNDSYASRTDSDARLFREGCEARRHAREAEPRLLHGHALMENRNGLVVDGLVSRATGTAERKAAWMMVLQREDPDKEIPLGADKAYDASEFVADCRGHGRDNARCAQHLGGGGARRSRTQWQRPRAML